MFAFNVTILCIILVIAFCLAYSLSKLIIISLGKFLVSYALLILTIYHKAPTNQSSIAQRAEGETSASPRIDTQSTLSVVEESEGSIIRKQDVRAWTGSNWLMIGTNGGHL